MIDGFLRGNFPITTSWSTWAKEILLVVAGLLTIANGLAAAVHIITFVVTVTGLLGPAPALAYFIMLILILFFVFFTVAFANIFGRVRKEIKNENP